MGDRTIEDDLVGRSIFWTYSDIKTMLLPNFGRIGGEFAKI